MRTQPILLLTCLAACQATPRDTNSVIADDAVDNAWTFLAAKYDTNRDGRIVEAEYTREGDFSRLDRNEDGVLDASDYPSKEAPSMGRDWDEIPSERKQRLDAMYSARAVMLTYFQSDPDAEGLHRDTLLEVFDALDMDATDTIDEAEFACATDALPWGGPGQARPLLRAGIDAPGNGDGRLSREELTEYHDNFANDEGYARGAPTRLTRVGETDVAADGAPAGTQAPDFTLAPLDGGSHVTLSDFQGDRPVALIFGSYT